MRKHVLFIIGSFIATVSAQTNMVIQTNAPVQSVDIDGYAAKVNDRVVTIGDVREAMAPMLPEIYRSYQGAELEEALQNAYLEAREELVQQALILESFKERGGQIPDQFVNDEIRRVINERFNGSEAQFEQALTSQKQSRSDYMDTVRNQMIVGMMVNEEITQRARVTPEEARNYYDTHKEENYFIPEKVKFSVIVLNKGESPEEQSIKLEEAKRIRQRLLEGEDFAETAKESSEGSRAAEGGLFAWMQPRDARTEWQELLETMPAGQISDIIETETQLCILKVEARRQAAYKAFSEVRDEIKNILLAQERKRLRDRWMERLMNEHYVRIYDE